MSPPVLWKRFQQYLGPLEHLTATGRARSSGTGAPGQMKFPKP